MCRLVIHPHTYTIQQYILTCVYKEYTRAHTHVHARTALCISVCFSMQSGAALSQNELMPTPNLHCALAKGASVNSMGELGIVSFIAACSVFLNNSFSGRSHF